MSARLVLVVLASLAALSLAHNKIPIKNMPINNASGVLAQVVLPYCLQALDAMIPQWDNNILPGNKTVHTLRNAAGLLRDMIDIFIYSYPIVKDPQNVTSEIALKISDDSEKLWQVLGHFWDLHSKPYNQTDLDEKRGECIDAIAKYNKHKVAMKYSLFLAHPKAKTFTYRNQTELSTLFWGWAGVVPLTNNTAIQNLALLLGAMWDVQIDRLNWVLHLPNIFNDTDSHHSFHAFRQLGRSCFDLYQNFEDVYPKPPPADLLATASLFHHKMGGVNGDVIKYHFYLKHNDWANAHKYYTEGTQLWQEAQQWFKQVNIVNVLTQLIQRLIRH